MRWLLSGASGFLGSALRVRLASQDHEVVRLVRRAPATSSEIQWDPTSGELDPAVLDGVDVVVNLSGAGVASGLWTAARREAILSSRTQTTGTLARALAARAATSATPVLLQASGISRYGTSSVGTPYTEDSPAASDFLAQVVVQWEAATQPAADAGVRVVLLRTSPVMGPGGGPFAPMKAAWSLGLGATLGDGRQRMPMISLEDYLGVLSWAAGHGEARGPYNLTLPNPTTNAEFTDRLAAALHRPRWAAAPKLLVRTALGELADQLVGDVWVLPQRLLDDGYVFADPDVDALIASALRAS
jgi:uncharacterized protein (TIGR01777 family)